MVAADTEGKAGQSSTAGEDVSTVGGAVRGTRDLGVVSLDDGGGDVDEGSSRISNGIDGARDERSGAYSVSGTGELPKAVGGVDSHVGDSTGVFARVNVAEVVVSNGALLQVGSEDGRWQRADHV